MSTQPNNGEIATEYCRIGNTFAYRAEIVDWDDDTRTETPVDITGWSFWMTLKNKIDDDDGDAVATTGEVTPSLPLTGVCVLRIPPDETAVLSGTYWFEVKYKDDQGDIQTIAVGPVHFGFIIQQDTD